MNGTAARMALPLSAGVKKCKKDSIWAFYQTLVEFGASKTLHFQFQKVQGEKLKKKCLRVVPLWASGTV